MNELLEFGDINDRDTDIDDGRYFDEWLVSKRKCAWCKEYLTLSETVLCKTCADIIGARDE